MTSAEPLRREAGSTASSSEYQALKSTSVATDQ
jgi:hypothetical protein